DQALREPCAGGARRRFGDVGSGNRACCGKGQGSTQHRTSGEIGHGRLLHARLKVTDSYPSLVVCPPSHPHGSPGLGRASERVLSVHNCGNTTSDNTCQGGQPRRALGAVVYVLGLRLCSPRGWVASPRPTSRAETRFTEASMKFTWFNLMPWPYLPDDFRAKHRSVWVDIPSTLYDPKKGHHVYHEYLDQLEYAETLGFDGIGCNEHHQNGYGLMPSPNLIAAGLARRTSRAAVCVIGNSIAGYNPPIRVAEEFAMLDVISGGRLLPGPPAPTPTPPRHPPPQQRKREGGPRTNEGGGPGARPLPRRRQPPPAAGGKPGPKPPHEPTPADLHPGRRLDRDVGLLPRLRLQLL